VDHHIIIDGSHGEGGGQVLRTALSLAALLQRPLAIHNIRANRKKPGLRPQHLAGVRALGRITAAEIVGDHENSTSLHFTPQRLSGGKYRFDIGTAGSVTLLAATILPALLFTDRPSTVIITGGTHVPFCPIFHYLQEIFLPFLHRMGGEFEAVLDAWGWYPKGGGSCTIQVTPCRGLQALHIPRRGALRHCNLLLGLAGLPLHIIDREEDHVRRRLQKSGYALERRFVPVPSTGKGNVLFLKGSYAESLAGFSALGAKGKPAEQVAEELCRDWLHFDQGDGTVDSHLADQILLYAALAQGHSFFITEKFSTHLLTNIEIIEQLLPVHFELDPEANSVGVTGVAYATPGEIIPDATHP
jgi:RNA 3'-terminal phosphate cyclase (ATP)